MTLNGETRKWAFRLATGTASLLIIFLSADIWNRVAIIDKRINSMEKKLVAPRYSSTDGLINTGCLLRGLKVAELWLSGIKPRIDSNRVDSEGLPTVELPVITEDIHNCVKELTDLRTDLLRRSRGLIP